MNYNLFFLSILFSHVILAQNFMEVIPSPFTEGVDAGSISFFDADEDSDFDVLITGGTGSDGFAKLFFNNGQGGFNEAIGTPFTTVFISAAAVADVDGDGDQDVLITGSLGGIPPEPSTKLYLNDGLGTFSEETGNSFNHVSGGSCAFADIDNDGDQDILITGLNQTGFQASSNLYRNDGTGNFSEIFETPFEGIAEGSIAFTDIDGDGDQDLLLTGQNNSYNPISKLYVNDGTGTFSEIFPSPFVEVFRSSIAFSDIDGDNDQDVLITGSLSTGGPSSKLYTNDGLGNYTEITDSPFDGVLFSSVAFFDVDGDGDQDVLIAGAGLGFIATTKLYTNDGTGNFNEIMMGVFDDVIFGSVAFSDIDGDSDQDVLIMGRDTMTNGVRSTKLYLNNNITSTNEIITKSNSFRFKIFSNPTTSDKININFEYSNSRVITGSIFESSGNKIMEVKKDIGAALDRGTFSIEISNLPKGIYFLQLYDGVQFISSEFVVQ